MFLLVLSVGQEITDNITADAIAIVEDSMRPKATIVAVRTLAQQDIQSLERIRERLIKTCTALANQLRGLLVLAETQKRVLG